MNDAIHAYKETLEMITKIQKQELLKIGDEINATIEKGEFCCVIKGKFLEETIEKVKEEGYKVKVIAAEIDDFGNMYPDFVRIDWRGNNDISLPQKIKNWFRRLKY